MAHYVQLMTLTPQGREEMFRDPHHLLVAQQSVRVDGVQTLGLYAVLGAYDFVSIVEAPDNEAVARYSLELGVRAGAHITTLPAVPVVALEQAMRGGDQDLDIGTELDLTPAAYDDEERVL